MISIPVGFTGEILTNIAALYDKYNGTTGALNITSADSVIPAPTAGQFVIGVDSTYSPASGTVELPDGWQLMVYNGLLPVTGGGPGQGIVGLDLLNYTGGAATVTGIEGSGTINDTASGALLSFFSGTYDVTAGGGSDTLAFDNLISGFGTVDGSDNLVLLGSGSLTGSGQAATVSGNVGKPNVITINEGTGDSVQATAGSDNIVFTAASTSINASGGDDTFNATGSGVMTVTATGGTQTITDDAGGGDVINAGTATEFVANATETLASAFNSSGGDDTVWGTSTVGVDYTGTGSGNLFFAAAAGTSTVTGSGSETVFGIGGSGTYGLGTTNTLFISNSQDSDTLTGGTAGGSLLAFGSRGDHLTLNTSTTLSSILVTRGEADTIDATNSAGHNIFLMANTSNPDGSSYTGDTTVVGSNAGGENFSLLVDSTSPTAHTITVENWQTSDTFAVFDVSNITGSASVTAADQATINNFNTEGGSSKLTLQDGTTISFVGAHPTFINTNNG